MTQPAPDRFKVTELQCDPDMRCDSTVVTIWDDGLEIGIDCVLEAEHADFDEGKHTDGDGTFWDDDGEIEYS